MVAREVDRAAQLLTEAEEIGAVVHAKALWLLDTPQGDLAVLSGNLQAALEHFARSLEAAQARGDELQIYHDLHSMAHVLALLGEDAAALEVAGVAEAHTEEMRGPGAASNEHLLGHAVGAARERVAPTLAKELAASGRAVPTGNRVTLACLRARAVTTPNPSSNPSTSLPPSIST